MTVKPPIWDTQALLAFHAFHFGDARMDDRTPEQIAADTASQPPAKTFTQEEVNALVAREATKAKDKTAADLAKELGVPIEDAKALIKDAKDRQDKELTDAQRAQQAAQRDQTKAQEAISTADQAIHKANLVTAMALAGVDPTKIERYAKLVEVEVGADGEAIKAAVETLKTEEPHLFGAGSGGEQQQQQQQQTPGRGGVSTAPGSHIKGTPPAPKVSEDAFARGLERAKKYGTAYTGAMPGTPQNA